jgi:F0F1-type ATP synthase membrane subunit a
MIIEFISYISRIFSLAIRLFANLMSGHTLLYILSTFIFKLNKKYILFLIIPNLIILCICFLEFCLAILQAYVFVVLTCIYLKDSLYTH